MKRNKNALEVDMLVQYIPDWIDVEWLEQLIRTDGEESWKSGTAWGPLFRRETGGGSTIGTEAWATHALDGAPRSCVSASFRRPVSRVFMHR